MNERRSKVELDVKKGTNNVQAAQSKMRVKRATGVRFFESLENIAEPFIIANMNELKTRP